MLARDCFDMPRSASQKLPVAVNRGISGGGGDGGLVLVLRGAEVCGTTGGGAGHLPACLAPFSRVSFLFTRLITAFPG